MVYNDVKCTARLPKRLTCLRFRHVMLEIKFHGVNNTFLCVLQVQEYTFSMVNHKALSPTMLLCVPLSLQVQIQKHVVCASSAALTQR